MRIALKLRGTEEKKAKASSTIRAILIAVVHKRIIHQDPNLEEEI